MTYDETLAERVRRSLKNEKKITEKKMFGGLAYLVEGKMSLGVLGKNLVVRVGAEEQNKLLHYPHVRPMDFTGRPMKSFLYVGPEAIVSGSSLAAWIRRGLAYAKTLPTKPKKKIRMSKKFPKARNL